MTVLMSLENITVSRANQVLFSHLSADIKAGDITVILGPNGAGKSSLLLAMAGLIPIKGGIRCMNQPLPYGDRTSLTQKLAWQGDLPPTEFGLTVQQRLHLVRRDSGHDGWEQIMKTLDIASFLQRSLGELSSGERQRVELAALMLRHAPLWLLDEPTAHLDLKYQVRCMQMLKKEAANGRGIVVVLHDLQQAYAIADHVILINGKGDAWHGTRDDLLNAAVLSDVFGVALAQKNHVLMPDYGL